MKNENNVSLKDITDQTEEMCLEAVKKMYVISFK